jgi:hypothetical protein
LLRNGGVMQNSSLKTPLMEHRPTEEEFMRRDMKAIAARVRRSGVGFEFDHTQNDKSLCEPLNASMPAWRCMPRRWRLAGIASVLASSHSIVTDSPDARTFARLLLGSACTD